MSLGDPTVADELDASAGGADTLTRDDIFSLLSNYRRRYVIRYLRQQGSTHLGELSERIAAWENETSLGQITSDERKRVYTSLQQIHLPKMREKGVVEYDQRSGAVDLGPAIEDVDIYLEVVEGDQMPWSKFYLLLSLFGGALMLASITDLYPFVYVPDGIWGGIMTGTFALASLVHMYHTRYGMSLSGVESAENADEGDPAE